MFHKIKIKAFAYAPLAITLTLLAWLYTQVTRHDFLGFDLIDDTRCSFIFYPLIYYCYFSEGRLVENFQWAMLGSGFVFSFLIYKKILVTEKVQKRAFFLFSAGLLLMLLEDWMNVRHLISSAYMIPAFDAWLTSTQIRMIWEAIFYAFLSSIMIGAFWCLLKSNNLCLKPNKRLFFGFALYGLVGFGSAFRRLFDWQERLGNAIIEGFNLKSLDAWQQAYAIYYRALDNNPDYGFSPGYLLVDHLVEESLELIAASFLLSGLLAIILPYYKSLKQQRIHKFGSGPN